jgi:hypothetical protein
MQDWSAEQLSAGGGATQDSVLLALLNGTAEAQGVVLLVAAAVARSCVQAEDQLAQRESKPKRETRARGLLAAALSKELRELGAGLTALVGRPLRLVDLVLPESQRWLRELLLERLRLAEFAKLPAVAEESEEWLERFAAQRVRSAPLPLFDSELELEWAVAQPERLPVGVLAPWLPVCPLAPAAGPVGVEGEGAALRVVCSRPDWRRLVLSVPAAQGAPLELLLSVMSVGRPAAEDTDSRELAAVIAAQAQELSERIQEAAEAVPPDKWLFFSLAEDQKAVCWLGRLAQALWRESVQERWDLGERRRRPKPVPAGPVEGMSVFLSAAGKSELVAGSGVRLLTAAGDDVEELEELEERVDARMIDAQSHFGFRLLRWLARDARALGGEGGEVKIRGGWTELAALVLGVEPAAVNKRDVTALRKAAESMKRLVQIPWAGKNILDSWFLNTATLRAPEDRRIVELVISVGPWARWDLVPSPNSLPRGQRPATRAHEIPPANVEPVLVLGPVNAAPELALPAALGRLFDDRVLQYPKGVRVTQEDFVKLLQRFGLGAAHAPLLQEEWLTAKKEKELTGRADVPPLLKVTANGGWQWNEERWPEGHEWHLRGCAAVLEAKALPSGALAGKGAKGKKGKRPPPLR